MFARQQLFTINVAGFFVAFQSTLSCALAVLAGILAWFLKKMFREIIQNQDIYKARALF